MSNQLLSRFQKILRFLLLVALPVAACWWSYTILTTPGLKPVVISAYSPPIIRPDKAVHDLGTVPTDSKVEHTFYLYNVGGRPLVIEDVDASCGCTVLDVSKKEVPPGDFSALKATLDTSIKLGQVEKTITVYSNDPDNGALVLKLTGNVVQQMKGHAPIAVKDPLVLFEGKCAECHVNQGVGKTGMALFQADCGMCHGMNAQGNVAPSLLSRDYHDPQTLEYLRKIIHEGSPHSPTMPPFSKANGGPLNDAEIDSLLNYLAFQASEYESGRE